MSPLHHYLVTAPTGHLMTFIGGPAQPAGNGHVWLTSPSGERILRAPTSAVRESSREQTLQLIAEDIANVRADRLARN